MTKFILDGAALNRVLPLLKKIDKNYVVKTIDVKNNIFTIELQKTIFLFDEINAKTFK